MDEALYKVGDIIKLHTRKEDTVHLQILKIKENRYASQRIYYHYTLLSLEEGVIYEFSEETLKPNNNYKVEVINA